MPKAFSDHEKETIRSQMRDKGKKLFEKQGLKKTSVDELAEAASISKGAFYLFYDSKEELFLEILEQLETELQTSILQFTIQPNADARKNVSKMLKSFLLSWEAYPLLKNFGKSDFEYLARKIPPQRIQQHAQRDTDFTSDFIKKIKREGIAVKASPRVVSSLIKSLFFISLHREDLGNSEYEESINVLAELVAGYIVGESK
jgi:AcrR family transcriptional regulator